MRISGLPGQVRDLSPPLSHRPPLVAECGGEDRVVKIVSPVKPADRDIPKHAEVQTAQPRQDAAWTSARCHGNPGWGGEFSRDRFSLGSDWSDGEEGGREGGRDGEEGGRGG
ncbi:hypothetical protein EYF80_040227 [Liparis tanakae]|uniref:Uncharacterized protein n=1 Tax=Liparis tanakae TaxID=230148 RepID=A0A4Z2GAG4_9TELE|nr:hypothetical protein EYF80_040227 [Liparis tanakae]